MTIAWMLLAGLLAGLLIGALPASRPAGCGLLLFVPAAMLVYVWVWQSQHPESIRSTSALDFIFGPLWPSFGAIAGFALSKVVRGIR